MIAFVHAVFSNQHAISDRYRQCSLDRCSLNIIAFFGSDGLSYGRQPFRLIALALMIHKLPWGADPALALIKAGVKEDP